MTEPVGEARGELRRSEWISDLNMLCQIPSRVNRNVQVKGDGQAAVAARKRWKARRLITT